MAPLFGAVGSDATAFRVIDAIARDPEGLGRLRAAHARARERAWELIGAPGRLTIDLDVTLLASHSDKEGAAGTFKGGFGFHPMLAYGEETGEALGAQLREGKPARTPPPTRSRSPRRRWSRSPPSTSRRWTSCCAPTRPGPSTTCWTGVGRPG